MFPRNLIRSLAAASFAAALCLSVASAGAHNGPGGAHTAVGATPARSPITAVFPVDQLDPATANAVKNSTVPVMIEFFDGSNHSQECVDSQSVAQQEIARYGSTLTLVLADVSKQDPALIQQGRIAVCPTHFLLIDQSDPNAIVARRVWGYLDQSGFEQLVHDVLGVQPPAP